MDDFVRNSRWVLIFHGDAPVARVEPNWDALVAAVKEELAGKELDPRLMEENQAVFDAVEGDGDGLDDWARDDFGKWYFRTDIGDCGHMRIYRVWDPPAAKATSPAS